MKPNGLFITAASIFVMFGMLLGMRLYQRHAREAEAERLFESGAYAAALTLYEELENEDAAALCRQRLREADYAEAERLVAAGDYRAAEALLTPLGNYRESAALLRDCAFLRAGALAAEGRAEEAREAYIALGDYPGCADALKDLVPALYERAMALAKGGEYERAAALWTDCGDYRDSTKLLSRAEKYMQRRADAYRIKVSDQTRRFDNPFYKKAYRTDEAYILLPEEANADTRFFLYFPGGRDEELYTEFLYYYMANPAPNTLAVFLRRNDLPDMEGCCKKGFRILDEAAADCGLFVDRVLAAGSSLGAYPALQSPRIAMRDFGIEVPCVLSLDAGNQWNEPELVPTVAQCGELAELGTHLYLFQPTWVDTDYPPVARLVDAGCWVMLAGCLHDEHEQITYDVFELGIIDWAMGDREDRCPGEIYSFRRLRK